MKPSSRGNATCSGGRRAASRESFKQWSRLKAGLLCDQRAWKKTKRNGAGKEVKNEKGAKGGISY